MAGFAFLCLRFKFALRCQVTLSSRLSLQEPFTGALSFHQALALLANPFELALHSGELLLRQFCLGFVKKLVGLITFFAATHLLDLKQHVLGLVAALSDRFGRGFGLALEKVGRHLQCALDHGFLALDGRR